MLEILIIIVVLALSLYVGSFWFSVGSFLVMLIFVLPGVYSLVFGAPFVFSTKKRAEVIVSFVGKNCGKVVELGCGDGRLIRKIAKNGAKEAVGYEFSIPTYLLAKILNYFDGGRAKIRFKNFWNVDYEDVDVLVCFLLDGSMRRFKNNIWPKLKKGAKVVSNEFEIPGLDAEKNDQRVFLYIKK